MEEEIVEGWFFQDQLLNPEQIPEKAIAFLYIITHKESGKWYIGRKNLTKPTYKTVKGKKKKTMVQSDWPTYWSSSPYLQEWVEKDGKEKFKREILIFVETAAATLYAEEALLYLTGGLFDEKCINGHIRTKVMRSWFLKKEADIHSRIISLPLFAKPQ